mgnify:CR=1 FL=1
MNAESAPAGAKRVLVVDDDPIVGESLAEFLRAEGYEVATAVEGAEALALLSEGERNERPYAIALLDVALPGTGGMDILREIAKSHRETAAVMMTGFGTVEVAVGALRLGAVDFLTKPMSDAELRRALDRASRHQAILAENRALRKRLEGRVGLDRIVGRDHRMQRIYELIEAVAPSRTTVLMTGESGTGKSLIASAIHQRSPRAGRAFVEVSCGSIPETLLESELFGHVKGAFTGAHADKPGRFLAADGGTLFLDEINSASPGMQLKLLRVLQERKFEPVGSNRTIEVDVRVILASNQPLEDLVAKGQFRQDLYYRINVVKVELPPLRDRVSDVPALAEHFLAVQGSELGRTFAGFTDGAMDALRRYSFPGNVRELSNIVERAAVLARGQTIGVEDLPEHVVANRGHALLDRVAASGGGDDDDDSWTPMPLIDALREPERKIILRALAANEWNRQQTADALGINRTTLYKKMKTLGIDGGEGERAAG